ncbi:unnamed protein product [Urochloa humidicola]
MQMEVVGCFSTVLPTFASMGEPMWQQHNCDYERRGSMASPGTECPSPFRRDEKGRADRSQIKLAVHWTFLPCG